MTCRRHSVDVSLPMLSCPSHVSQCRIPSMAPCSGCHQQQPRRGAHRSRCHNGPPTAVRLFSAVPVPPRARQLPPHTDAGAVCAGATVCTTAAALWNWMRGLTRHVLVTLHEKMSAAQECDLPHTAAAGAEPRSQRRPDLVSRFGTWQWLSGSHSCQQQQQRGGGMRRSCAHCQRLPAANGPGQLEPLQAGQVSLQMPWVVLLAFCCAPVVHYLHPDRRRK